MSRRSASEKECEREESIRTRVTQLSAHHQREYYHSFSKSLKDPDTYAVLNYLFLGGLHHFYLRRWVRGGVNLALFVAGVAMLLQGHGYLGLGLILLVTLVELPALFFAQNIVAKYNNDLSESLLADYESEKL